ncbi:MAG: Trk family potassium uptake protein, partial [Clostridia bacterium]|nr:Trk family potassium uptake protein [Clostridia bacterium]
MKIKFRHRMSVWQYLALGYLLVILLGSVLLVLPFAARDGGTSYLDALFTATSATCVTGLVVYDTSVHWSTFGQIVILMLIQTGGLGFSTFVTVLFMMIRRGSLGVYEKRTIMQTFGGNRLAGAGKLILRVVVGTFVMEAAGACLLMIRFVPQFGGLGVYYAVFHAVSAFCNAGFDLMGKAGAEFV